MGKLDEGERLETENWIGGGNDGDMRRGGGGRRGLRRS